MVVTDAEVVIVGAGLAGLSTAVFLGLHDVPALVVERHPGTSVQPKARGQNPLVMEALGSAGLTGPILAATPPGRPAMTIVISERMSGPVLHSFTEEFPDLAELSPAPYGMASQASAEAALAARARELGARVVFRTRCAGISQDPHGVTVTLRSAHGEEWQARAQYLVAADGHKGQLREWVGIGAHGRGVFESVTTVRFLADLSAWAGKDAVVLHYLHNRALPGGTGVLVSTDNPGEWVAGMTADPARDEAASVALIRTLVGVPDLELTVLDQATWEYAHRVADRFQAGRVLLVGDAAHLMPPTGGQGGNTAVLDGYHLGWKLAAVVRGQAGAGLLDSHDAERRPFAERVCDWQVANMVVRQRPELADDSIGSPEDPVSVLYRYTCPSGAFVAEPPSSPGSAGRSNPPAGRPGSRVPHVRLTSASGEVSPRELLGPRFVVFTASADGVDAARLAARELGMAVGPDLVACRVDSTEPLGTGPSGTVLVRPDGVVAWRGDDANQLAPALRTVLHR